MSLDSYVNAIRNLGAPPDLPSLIAPPHIKFKRLDPRAALPVYASAGAGAFDVSALDACTVHAHNSRMIGTGLAFQLPPGYGLIITSRSGHGAKHGIRLANPPGLIDSDYIGQLFVVLHNDRAVSFEVAAGERIAQCMLVELPQATFEEVEDLAPTERGEGGFGSTGK